MELWIDDHESFLMDKMPILLHNYGNFLIWLGIFLLL